MSTNMIERVPLSALIAAAAMAFSGCGGPYYVLEGHHEIKTLVIHRDDGGEIRINLGSGVGGGVLDYIGLKAVKDAEGPIEFTVQKDRAVVMKFQKKNGEKITIDLGVPIALVETDAAQQFREIDQLLGGRGRALSFRAFLRYIGTENAKFSTINASPEPSRTGTPSSPDIVIKDDSGRSLAQFRENEGLLIVTRERNGKQEILECPFRLSDYIGRKALFEVQYDDVENVAQPVPLTFTVERPDGLTFTASVSNFQATVRDVYLNGEKLETKVW